MGELSFLSDRFWRAGILLVEAMAEEVELRNTKVRIRRSEEIPQFILSYK